MRTREDYHDRDALTASVRSLLSTRERRTITSAGLRPSAVLVPLCWIDGSPHILLTRRSMTVEYHKGEISFPGGHAEPCDSGPEATALRETHEEIGVHPADVEILGLLDDYITIFGFHITPVVGIIPYPHPIRMNSETESIITLPLEYALADQAWMSEKTTLKGLAVDIFCIEAAGGFIWGATARMLKQFAEILAGRPIPTGAMKEAARIWITGIISAQKRYAQKL